MSTGLPASLRESYGGEWTHGLQRKVLRHAAHTMHGDALAMYMSPTAMFSQLSQETLLESYRAPRVGSKSRQLTGGAVGFSA